MDKFIFITDLHVTSTCNVRTGDVLEDICSKLENVVRFSNKHKMPIIIGGDIFDKPTVPDFVKAAVARVFRKAKSKIYTINGNHDTLYNNEEFNVRTSYNLFAEIGLFEDFTGTSLDLDDCVLTNVLPLKTNGKPTICVYHGFWNIDDGKWNCKTSDVIPTEDETVVLLGHDHTVYDEEQPRENITVIRPGSLLRGIRIDEQNRTPMMAIIEINDGKWNITYEPIKCRAAAEIFESKQFTISKTEVKESYSSVIDRLKNARTGEMTLDDALKQVTDQEIIDYINFCLGE